ncbi:MAG: Gx transporter family protein [Clostridia bacterium]|nr:Gx transporter family protein [Clostridia bacterium]
MVFHNKKTVYLGILASFAIICGYIETLIPFFFGIPGMKLGLANIVTVIALYQLGIREAASISLVRILIVGMLFGNPYSITYSLAGGVFSLLIMFLFKQIRFCTVIGVSIIGGILHNIGQILVAVLIVDEFNLIYYVPILVISGSVTGLLIGILAKALILRIERIIA